MITWLDKIDGLDLGDPQKNVNAADMNQIKNQHNALETNVPVQIAAAVNGVLGGSPANLDTLGELAQAINNDPDFYNTLVALLALKAPLASPTFTGIPAAPTAAAATDTTQVATTAFVHDAIGNDTVWGEVPSGAINDVNDTYTILTTAQKLAVYKNGLRQNPSSYTFTPGTNTFVMSVAPETGDTLLTDYQK